MRVPDVPLRGALTVVRPATDTDADLLVDWHADPEIARYWDYEQFSRAEILARLAEPNVDAYIVDADDRPVGYLQAWFDVEPGTGGLDMFLIPAARGHGLGPDAARALARHLLASGLQRLSVDPYRSNDVAIRAWTKAGFRAVEERKPDSEHSEAWLFMVFEPASLG
jgi:aminoglycoside 6'-N-acetyltransferase